MTFWISDHRRALDVRARFRQTAPAAAQVPSRAERSVVLLPLTSCEARARDRQHFQRTGQALVSRIDPESTIDQSVIAPELKIDRSRDRSMTDNRAGRIENRQQYQDNRFERRDEVRDQVRDNYPRLDFWSEYPGWAALRISRPYRWATWGALAGWCGGYGWSEPTPYSYGENVYYQDNSVYYGDQVVATSEEYAQQAAEIVASVPEDAPAPRKRSGCRSVSSR